jgi:hypothetical protein
MFLTVIERAHLLFRSIAFDDNKDADADRKQVCADTVRDISVLFATLFFVTSCEVVGSRECSFGVSQGARQTGPAPSLSPADGREGHALPPEKNGRVGKTTVPRPLRNIMRETLIDVDFMLSSSLLLPQNVGQLSTDATISTPDGHGRCPHDTIPLYNSAAITALLEHNERPNKPDQCVKRPQEKHASLISRPVRSEFNLAPESGDFLTCPVVSAMTMSHNQEILVPLTRIDTTMCNDLTLDQQDPIFDRQPTATASVDRILASGQRLEKRMLCTSDQLLSFTSPALMPSATDPPSGTYCYMRM